jgi:hypothetical protein
MHHLTVHQDSNAVQHSNAVLHYRAWRFALLVVGAHIKLVSLMSYIEGNDDCVVRACVCYRFVSQPVLPHAGLLFSSLSAVQHLRFSSWIRPWQQQYW